MTAAVIDAASNLRVVHEEFAQRLGTVRESVRLAGNKLLTCRHPGQRPVSA